MTTTARQKFDAYLARTPLKLLIGALMELEKKGARDDAEKLALTGMTAELSKRMRVIAALEPTEALTADYRKFATMEFVKMDKVERTAYWAVSGEMERRFPEAAAAANEWLDALTPEEMGALPPNSWDQKFLALAVG